MEEIIIKEIKKFPTAKGDGMAVVLNGNRKATIAAWHKQEQDYVEKDVGVGGRVKCDIVQKGEYTNLENFDFNSAVKNDLGAPVEKINAEPTTKPNPQRVGLFIKLAVEMLVAAPQEGKNVEENLCENIQEIKRLEEFTIKLLE